MCGPFAAAFAVTAACCTHEGGIRVRAVTAGGSSTLPRLQGALPSSGTLAQAVQDRSRLDRVSVDRPKPHHGSAATAAETWAAAATSSLVEFPLPQHGN
jgi:hypothetical protein